MAKKAKISTQTNIEIKSETTKTSHQSDLPLIFEKRNYMLMILGLAVIFLGYILMMGKNNSVESIDAIFPASDVYSFRRIILAPIIIIIGFLIELYSILSIKKSVE